MTTRALVEPQYYKPSDSVLNWDPLIYWVMLIPMLYFAANGTLSFLGGNNTQLAGYAALGETGAGSGMHAALSFGCYLIVMGGLLMIRDRLVHLCVQNWVIFALPILAFMSAAWSQYPSRTVLYSGYIMLNTLFALYLASRFRPEQQINLFLLTGTFAAIGSLVEGVVYPTGGVDVKAGTRALEGIYPHKNIAAMLTLLFLIPVFCIPIKTPLQRAFRFGYTVISLAVIVLTTARTGWLQTGIVLIAMVGLRWVRKFSPKDRPTVIFFLAPLAVGGIIFATIAYPYLALLMGKDPTLTGRTVIWAACIKSAMKRPMLGYGFYAFWTMMHGEAANTAMAAGDVSLGNAEDGVLQLWLELGLVGVAILFAMVLRTCRNAMKVAFRKDMPEYVDWYIALLVFTLLSVVDGAKFLIPHALYWMMYLIADVGLANEARRAAEKDKLGQQPESRELLVA